MGLVNRGDGNVSRVELNGERIASASDFLDLLMGEPCETIALAKEDFVDDFYDLRTGLLGTMLQKVVTYGKRLIILGDFSRVEKKSLRDFILESNETGKIVFAPTLELAIGMLR
jgi:hypothetical protein